MHKLIFSLFVLISTSSWGQFSIIPHNVGISYVGETVTHPGGKLSLMYNLAQWNKVNKKISLKFQELKSDYEKLIDDFKWNEIIYNSKFSFEPVIGDVYYLYIDKSNEYFLSLINPESWKKECVGKFSLNSEGKWIKSI